MILVAFQTVLPKAPAQKRLGVFCGRIGPNKSKSLPSMQDGLARRIDGSYLHSDLHGNITKSATSVAVQVVMALFNLTNSIRSRMRAPTHTLVWGELCRKKPSCTVLHSIERIPHGS